MKTLDLVAGILAIIGALNWGLVAVANFDLVATIFGMRFGQTSFLSSVVYGLVGLSGLYLLFFGKGLAERRHTALPRRTESIDRAA